jgi:uncharacterized phiE125 gp8 family phage protein
MNDPQSNLVLISAPATEPVAVSDAKNWLRIDPDQTQDDADIALLISAAREHAEAFCRRSFLVGEQWRMSLDHFPLAFLGAEGYTGRPLYELYQTEGVYLFGRAQNLAVNIPMGPVTAITGITYLDPAGTQQTIDPTMYALQSDDVSAAIYPAYPNGWPATRNYPGAVQVTFTAGVAPPARVPLYIRQTLAHWYANREAVVMISGVVPQEVLMAGQNLLWPLRNLSF